MSAWTKIEHEEVGSGGIAGIVFDNIPNTYTDLCIKFSGRGSTANISDDLFLKINDSSSNFTYRSLTAWNTVASYNGSTNFMGWSNGTSTTSNTFSNIEIYIPNYTSSNAKSISIDGVGENNSSTNYLLNILASLWNPATQAAITKLELYHTSGNIGQYSSATLYGIAKGSSGGVTVS
jgi:hypothetical protein